MRSVRVFHHARPGQGEFACDFGFLAWDEVMLVASLLFVRSVDWEPWRRRAMEAGVGCGNAYKESSAAAVGPIATPGSCRGNARVHPKSYLG